MVFFRCFAISLLLSASLSFAVDQPAELSETANRLAGSIYTGPSANTLSELADGYGGRLTGSPEYRRATEWAEAKFRSYGIQNVRVEPFPMSSGWQRGWAHAEMTAPLSRHLYIESLGWSPSTPAGGIKGNVIEIQEVSAEKIKAQAGQIKGHIVLLNLDKLFAQGFWKSVAQLLAAPKLLKDAGALAVLVPDSVTNNAHSALGLQWGGDLTALPAGEIGMEDTKLVRRLLERGPVTIQFEFQDKVSGPIQVNNVIAEIPGSEHPDEWILLGAHFDSWDYGTGAQDNGSGAAMVIEAARALAAMGKRPRRTIRFALWGGEEQGLLGSYAYSLAHKDEMSKCIAVLNTDNGAGHPEGWKVEGREDLKAAMKPLSDSVLKNLSGGELSMETTYDTDHGPFLLQGVPVLDLLVDESHYGEVHHKASDTFDKVDPLFLKSDTAILAVTAYAIEEAQQPIVPHIDHAAVGEILKKADLDQFLTDVGVWKP